MLDFHFTVYAICWLTRCLSAATCCCCLLPWGFYTFFVARCAFMFFSSTAHPTPSPSPRLPPSCLWRSLLGLLLLHFMHRLALVFCVLLDSNCIASCQLRPLPRSATACCKCCKQQLELASRLAKGTNDELSSINWRSANLLTVTWPSCIPRARGACVAHSALWADFS